MRLTSNPLKPMATVGHF